MRSPSPPAEPAAPPEVSAAAQAALDRWEAVARERGEAEHPLTALQRDKRFAGEVGMRLVVGVRRGCLAAVSFAESRDSPRLRLPRLVGDRPAWAEEAGEAERQQAEQQQREQEQREQERERQVDVAVQKALTDWLVAQRADNVYLDTLPQERQAEQRARIRQALLKQRGAEAQPQTPEGVAREKVEDFAVTVLGLWVTREGEEGQGGLVMTKPPGYEFGVA